MAQRYEIKAKGLGGTSYRVELHDSTYTGSTVTTLDADSQFLRIVGGSNTHVGLEPVWGKEARFNVRTDEDLSSLFGLEDRDVEARVYDIDTSTLVFKGYVLTDFFTDNPWSSLPGIELRAADGLTTLEGDNFGLLGYDGDTALSQIIVDILSTLYSSPLDVEIGTEWYPSSGGTLGSSDNPLEKVLIDPDNYREERPEGSFFNRRAVLEDLCQGQGFVIKQARVDGTLVWTVYQRTHKEGGSIKSWRYNADGTLQSGQPVTRDLTKTIDVPIAHEPKREFERRVESVSVTHNHTDLAQLLVEGGFEDGGAEWNLFDDTGYDTTVEDHTNEGPTPDSTQQNSKVLKVQHNSNPSSASLDAVASQNGLEGPRLLPAGSYGAFSFKYVYKNTQAGRLRLNIGDNHYLTGFTVDVGANTLKGKGSLPLNSGIDRPIPRGTLVPIVASSTTVSIELSERAPAGATELIGELSADVDKGDTCHYAGLVLDDPAEPVDPDYEYANLDFSPWLLTNDWKKRDIYFSLVDANGDKVSGTADLALMFYHASRNTSDYPTLWWDDIKFGLYGPDGSAINSSTRTASVPEFGQSKSITLRSSSGPNEENIAALQGDGFKATGWGIGSGGGSLSLAGLNARERLRHSRNHLERIQLTALIRDGDSFQVDGHEVIEWDGTDYTVAAVEHNPDSGQIELTLLELVDHGTTDLSIETTRSTSDGGGTTSGTASGGVGQVTDWPDITNKPAWVDLLTTEDGDLKVLEDLKATGFVEAFTDGSGTAGSDVNSELMVKDDGTSLTSDAASINFVGGTVTQNGDDITVDITGSAEDFLAGNLLSFDTGTSPRTLDVNSNVPRVDQSETVTASWELQSQPILRNEVAGDGAIHEIAQFALDASSSVSDGFGGYIGVGQARSGGSISGQATREGARFGSYIVSGAETQSDTMGAFISVRDDDTYRRAFELDNKGNAKHLGFVEANSFSDARYKSELAVIGAPFETLDAMSGYSFEWDSGAAFKEGSGHGLLAQEVQEVMPEAVTKNGAGHLGLDYDQIIPVLVEAVKQLRQELQEVK